MIKHKKVSKSASGKKVAKAKKNKSIETPKDLLDSIDQFFTKKQSLLFKVFFGSTFLFTLFLFDMKVSVGGDDANYIIKAWDFINEFKFPSFQGPAYPVFLSLFIWLFGINLPILKFISTLFLVGHFVAFYYAFKNKIPSAILFSTLILISINAYLLFYGSQTYTETFFMCIQMLFFLFFFQNFIAKQPYDLALKNQLKTYLYLGYFILALGLIRSIGYATIIVVILYFLSQRQWKAVGFSTFSFVLAMSTWKILKLAFWQEKSTQFSNQASSLFLVHPYDATQGTESIFGFFQRFIDNSNIYISKHFFKLLGLRPEIIKLEKGFMSPEVIPFLTILVYLVLLIAIYGIFKKNKYLLFSGIYLATMLGITFIILQTIWESTRLIIPFFPFLLMFILTGIYELFKFQKLKNLQFIFPVVVAILFYTTFKVSTVKVKENQKNLSSSLRGNILAGLTPDWKNYINMSKWAAKNVPENVMIASRKPNISFIYTKRRFRGIYKIPQNTNPDSLLQNLYDHNVKFVIMASLRKYEAQKTQYTINTIHRYLYFIQQKYPEKIRMVKQIGADEPAYLFEIK
ncbi:MAG: hypothetical protein ABFS35_01605 [Bacteroidota bacterium]